MSSPLRSPASSRWIATVVTVLCCAALLYPGRRSEDFTLESFLKPPADTGDLLEVATHFLIFTLLTYLWYRALSASAYRLQITIAAVLFLAFGTEFAQLFVQRGVSVFDLGANIIGIVTVSMMLRRPR